jgi:hypothetical protein
MSMIKPVANQRSSVGMMEIMGSRMGRFAAMDRRVTWPPAKPPDGFCGVLFGIAENVAKRGGGLPIRRGRRARRLWKRSCREPYITRAWWCSLGLGHEPVVCLAVDGAARLCVAVHPL